MIGAIIGGVASLAGSLFGGGKARRAAAEAAKETSRLEANKINSSIASKPINIRWIRTGSQT